MFDGLMSQVVVYTAIALAAILFASPFFWWTARRSRVTWDRPTLVLFLAMPITWLWLGPLGAAYALPALNNKAPEWPNWAVGCSILLFLMLSVVLIHRMEQGRAFASAWFVVNLPCCLLVGAVAGMAVSGDWI